MRAIETRFAAVGADVEVRAGEGAVIVAMGVREWRRVLEAMA